MDAKTNATGRITPWNKGLEIAEQTEVELPGDSGRSAPDVEGR